MPRRACGRPGPGCAISRFALRGNGAQAALPISGGDEVVVQTLQFAKTCEGRVAFARVVDDQHAKPVVVVPVPRVVPVARRRTSPARADDTTAQHTRQEFRWRGWPGRRVRILPEQPSRAKFPQVPPSSPIPTPTKKKRRAIKTRLSSVLAVHPSSNCGHRLVGPAGSGQAAPWHPRMTAYGCYLPVLTRFTGPRRTGPSLQRHLAKQSRQPSSPRRGIRPRYSGLRVQGTASSPSSTTNTIVPEYLECGKSATSRTSNSAWLCNASLRNLTPKTRRTQKGSAGMGRSAAVRLVDGRRLGHNWHKCPGVDTITVGTVHPQQHRLLAMISRWILCSPS